LKKKQLIFSGVVALVLIALVLWARQRIPFDFGVFRVQLLQADWSRIGWAFACIYAGYIIRSVRWALLMRHNRKVGMLSLLGTQVIGFTAVALIGRVADLVRPYLVAKKTQTAVSAQVAVYIVERLSDAGAMALIFSAVIVLSSSGDLPHPEIVRKAGYGGLAAAIAGALFLVFLRLSGDVLASVLERVFGVVSHKLAQAVGERIRTFRTGLDTIRSFSDFAMLTVLSVAMWILIAAAYLLTTLAFVKSPQLAAMTPGKAVLLMLASGGASIMQLPVIGWFTQIGIVAAAMRGLGASVEASTACAATLLLVTFLGIVPVGLVWAQVQNVSLRGVAEESEEAGEELKAQEASDAAAQG
jgi:glycosyltransferase 2 family protein